MTYIEIPRWDEFQHYGKRQPPWIKNYTRLLDDDAYLALTWAQRGLLHGIWLAYAKSNRNLVQNTSNLTRQLGQRVDKRTLEALNHGGFVLLPASNVLADCSQAASTETETETKEPKSASPIAVARPPARVDGVGNPVADVVKDLEAFRRERRAG